MGTLLLHYIFSSRSPCWTVAQNGCIATPLYVLTEGMGTLLLHYLSSPWSPVWTVGGNECIASPLYIFSPEPSLDMAEELLHCYSIIYFSLEPRTDRKTEWVHCNSIYIFSLGHGGGNRNWVMGIGYIATPLYFFFLEPMLDSSTGCIATPL